MVWPKTGQKLGTHPVLEELAVLSHFMEVYWEKMHFGHFRGDFH